MVQLDTQKTEFCLWRVPYLVAARDAKMKKPWALPFTSLKFRQREKHAKKKKKDLLLDRIKYIL